MTVVRKQFNRALYEAYDAPARNALVFYLEDNGHTIVNNEENYNVGVISQKGAYTYYNEAEVKTAWKGDWPSHWAEVRIPERKQRLLEMYKFPSPTLVRLARPSTSVRTPSLRFNPPPTMVRPDMPSISVSLGFL